MQNNFENQKLQKILTKSFVIWKNNIKLEIEIKMLLKSNKSAQTLDASFKFPKIDSKPLFKSSIKSNQSLRSQNMGQYENESLQVSKLQDWTQNKRVKKSRKVMNSIAYLYRSSTLARKQSSGQYRNSHQFLEVQLFFAKLDKQLQKISEISYSSIYKNFQYCSGVYQNSYKTLLKNISKHKATIQQEVDQIQLKLEMQRAEHLKKVHQLQDNNDQSYKKHISSVRELLQQKQEQIKPMRRMLQNISVSRVKVLKHCLSLGYDVRQEGLVWILKQLGTAPKMEQFPSFLSTKQIKFIINKYINYSLIQFL